MKTQYAIIIKHEMYQPCYDGRDHAWAMTQYDLGNAGPGDYETAIMDLDKARRIVDRLDSENYTTGNGEAGRPYYWIVPESALNTLQGRWADTGLYDWPDNGEPCASPEDGAQCGECPACIDWMLGQDDELLEAAKVEAENDCMMTELASPAIRAATGF